MPNFDELLKKQQAAKLIGNPDKLEQLRDAPETQKIFAMLSQSMGDLEQAAGKASQGDTSQLVSAIKQLMQNPEGKKLIEQMKENLK